MRDEDNHRSRLVYSTEHADPCPTCGRRLDHCRCRRPETPPSSDGFVRVGRSTRGRKGKGVTVITGMPVEGDRLKQIARILKQKCGGGGTVKAGTIEIQGDHRDLLVAELTGMGYRVRRSGG